MEITLKEVYDYLVTSNEITDVYEQVKIFEEQERDWAFHNYNHVSNVSKLAEKILNDLDCDEDTIYKCKIACLLHDVGCTGGKEGHQKRSYEYAKNFFEEKDWNFDGKDEILDAILNHSSGFDSDNIVTLAIILADKLDVKKDRISKYGMEVIGNRQFQHVNNIDITIKDNVLTINFITDGNLDVDELNNYYFTTKIFKAIKTFANKFNLDYEILMDNNKWILSW